MAANHVSNQRQKGSRKGSGRSGGKLRRSSKEDEGNYGMIGEFGHQASGYLERGATQFRELTRDREGTAALIAMAAGFGVGVVVGGLIASSTTGRQKTWSQRIAAEGIGHRLLERIESLIPDAISERFTK